VKLVLFFTLFFITSCTSVKYVSSSNAKVGISSPRKVDKIRIKYEKTFDFVLWGNEPHRGHIIDFDEDVFRNETYAVGNLVITQYQTGLDKFLTFFSFGMIIPYHLKVEGWGEVDETSNQ
jgi:hypothetical protein